MLGRGLERQGLEEKEVPPGLMGGLCPAPSADTNVFNLTSILLSDYSPIRLLSRGPASLEPTANADSVWDWAPQIRQLARAGSSGGVHPAKLSSSSTPLSPVLSGPTSPSWGLFQAYCQGPWVSPFSSLETSKHLLPPTLVTQA